MKRVLDGESDPDTVDGRMAGFALAFQLSAAVSRIKTLIWSGPLSLFAVLAALVVYPLMPFGTLSMLLASTLLMVLAVDVVIILGLDRDPVLSRLNGTEPGKLTRNFYRSILLRHAVTLLVVFFSLFPSLGRQTLSWFMPVVRSLLQL